MPHSHRDGEGGGGGAVNADGGGALACSSKKEVRNGLWDAHFVDDVVHSIGVDVIIGSFEVSKDYVSFEAVAESEAEGFNKGVDVESGGAAGDKPDLFRGNNAFAYRPVGEAGEEAEFEDFIENIAHGEDAVRVKGGWVLMYTWFGALQEWD